MFQGWSVEVADGRIPIRPMRGILLLKMLIISYIQPSYPRFAFESESILVTTATRHGTKLCRRKNAGITLKFAIP